MKRCRHDQLLSPTDNPSYANLKSNSLSIHPTASRLCTVGHVHTWKGFEARLVRRSGHLLFFVQSLGYCDVYDQVFHLSCRSGNRHCLALFESVPRVHHTPLLHLYERRKASDCYPDDALLAKALETLSASHEEASFLVPVGAVRAIECLRSLVKGGKALIIAGDKG